MRRFPTAVRERAVVALAAWLLFPAAASLADYRSGLAAYRAGDFEYAFAEWQTVAQSPPGSVDPDTLAETQYALGMLYWTGQGVPQSSGAAAHWLAQAAELNHVDAMTKLGFLYSTGNGVTRSEFEAFKYFHMAARQGSADAQYNLGVLYREGLGVPANGTEALKWFREAAANGDAESARIVAQYEAGVPVGSVADRPVTGGEKNVVDPPPTDPVPAPSEPLSAAFAAAPESQAGPANTAPHPGGLLDEGWIAQRPPEHYTIQVIALRDFAKLQTLIGRHEDWTPFATYRQTLRGEPIHVLVQGDYADVADARAAARRFPTDIQKRDSLWIRRFVMVQGALE